ncbi:MAG: flagellin [Pseudobdellovibrionaceae bacterium]
MGLRISTNMPSITAQRQLAGNQKKAEKASAALASGNRITSAADDAAGLAISESMRGQIRGIAQARNNAFNAGSAIQVSEGGLNEISNILIRVRELGIQAASDNIGDAERSFLDNEAQQILQEADRIARTTRFGDKILLDGSGGEQEFHVGAFGGEENVIKFSLSADATAGSLGIDGISVVDKGSARDALSTVDEALLRVGELRANFGAIQNRLQTTTSNLDIQYENLSAAKSRISDTDIAKESSEYASSQILQQAAVAVLSQANQSQGMALRLLG